MHVLFGDYEGRIRDDLTPSDVRHLDDLIQVYAEYPDMILYTFNPKHPSVDGDDDTAFDAVRRIIDGPTDRELASYYDFGRDTSSYRRDMKNAGRGHLLGD
jgi:hypothetical protein